MGFSVWLLICYSKFVTAKSGLTPTTITLVGPSATSRIRVSRTLRVEEICNNDGSNLLRQRPHIVCSRTQQSRKHESGDEVTLFFLVCVDPSEHSLQ